MNLDMQESGISKRNLAIPQSEFDKAKDLLLRSNRILIISHRNPDPDSIGANLALREMLESNGKKVDSAAADPVPENCLFLKNSEKFLNEFNSSDYDLIVTVDCGGHELMKFHEWKPELLNRKLTTIINIDHHPSNDRFGNVNIVMDTTPATCFILYIFFGYCGWEINKDIATALLHGLYFDTGSFMHSNTCAETLRIAARLKARGADHYRCVKEQFHKSSISKLRLWGRALSRLNMNQNRAVVSAITERDFHEEKTEPEDLSGLINYVNSVPDAKFCVLLTEDMKGNIKGSLRTQREDIDLTRIAGLFGGGGHKKASGFSIKGKLSEKVVWEVT